MFVALTVGGYSQTVQAQEERGHQLGRWWVLPSLEMGGFYDSNPSASGDDTDGSTGVYVAPNIEAKSDFERHSVSFELGGRHMEYVEGEESRSNLFGSADTHLEIKHDLILTSGVRGGYFEDRYADPEVLLDNPLGDFATPLGAADPVTYTTFEAWSSLEKTFNRLSVSADAAYHTADYEDVDALGGGTLDQDFRDGDIVVVGGRAGYLFSPGYSMFVDAHYNDRSYDSGIGDSSGFRALSGLKLEITNLITGEVGVGYMHQDFDTGDEESGFSYHVGLTWNPTQLMIVRLAGDRYVGESSIADSPGTIATTFIASVGYEVLRTLVVTPFVGVGFQDYVSSPLEEEAIFAGVGADYDLNRFLSIGFDYRYENVDYSSGGTDYDRHFIGVNATAYF
jgi:hypothetical protein